MYVFVAEKVKYYLDTPFIWSNVIQEWFVWFTIVPFQIQQVLKRNIETVVFMVIYFYISDTFWFG